MKNYTRHTKRRRTRVETICPNHTDDDLQAFAELVGEPVRYRTDPAATKCRLDPLREI